MSSRPVLFSPHRVCVALIGVVCLLVGALVSAGPASAAATTAKVSGTVSSAESSTGLEKVLVTASHHDWDSSGNYTFSAVKTLSGKGGGFSTTLTEGYWRLCFNQTQNADRDDDARDNTALSVTCTSIYVDPGKDQVANAALSRVWRISGVVSTIAKKHPASATFAVYQANTSGRWRRFNTGFTSDGTYTPSTGSYTINGVPDGTYRVCVKDDAGNHLGCYGGTWLRLAQNIPVAGAPSPNANVNLPAQTSVSGRVLDASKAPVQEGYVRLFHEDTSSGTTAWVSDGYHPVDPDDGTYNILTPVEKYKLEFSGSYYSNSVTEYYENKRTIEAADPVTLTAQPRRLNDVMLEEAPVIRGTVDFPSGSEWDERQVTAVDGDGNKTSSGYIDSDGKYSISGLAPGTYRVEFDRTSGEALGAAQFFDNKAETAGQGAATTFTLGFNDTATANAAVARGRVLTGKVVDATGSPLNYAHVLAYTDDQSLVTRSVYADYDGTFRLTGLTDGAYHLAVDGGPLGMRYLVGSDLSPDKAAATNVKASASDTPVGTLVFGEARIKPSTGQPPAISGTPQVGSALTANHGGFTTTATYAYQWLANGAAISGATGTTYTPTAADFAKSLSVQVTASNPSYGTASATSAGTSAVQAAPSAPAAPAPVTYITRGTARVVGTAKVGSRLTTAVAGWGPSGVTYSYQWRANGVAIAKATGSSFVPGASQYRKAISVAVTGVRAGSPAAAPVVSSATKAVALGSLSVKRNPTIRGTAKVNQVLSVVSGVVSPRAVAHYQWLRNGLAIRGATRSAYRLTKADKRRAVSLKVTYTSTGYASAVRVTRGLGVR